MLLAVDKCPMLCLIGGLLAFGCSGEPLTLGGADRATSAAESGRPAPTPTQQVVTSSGGAPAPSWVAAAAGGGSDGRAAGVAGGMIVAAGASGSSPQSAAAAGSTSRLRRRDSDAGAAEGGGGAAGVRGVGQSMSRAGSGGVKAGAPGAVANGCVQNLACQLSAAQSSGDAHQDCVDRINQFRQECACLAPLERWVEGEACADDMAKYDSGGAEAHAAFGDKICEGGSAQNECPGWRSEAQVVGVCLQKMWDEGPPPMSDCSGSCFQMYGHFLNMTNQRMTKVACGFHETDEGQVWSVQNFSR